MEKESEFREVVRDDIQIIGSTATWTMRLDGAVSGTYTGTFQFRCFLTPLQRIAAGREQRALLGESRAFSETPDYEHEAWLAYLLTQLKYRIISAPPFWATSGINKSHEGDIPDENVLEKVLDAATDAELIYKQRLRKLKEEALVKANVGAKAVEEQLKKEDPAETME
jgi:hypothetical protein